MDVPPGSHRHGLERTGRAKSPERLPITAGRHGPHDGDVHLAARRGTVAVVVLAAVHLIAGRLRVLDVIPRSRVLSIAGGALGALTSVDRALLVAPFAFLSGGIVLDVIKGELPPQRESRFSAFAIGAGAYAAPLLLL